MSKIDFITFFSEQNRNFRLTAQSYVLLYLGSCESVLDWSIFKFKPGDRVTMTFHTACGQGRACYGGHSNLCRSGFGANGFQFNGGYGQLVVMPAADINLVHLPDAVDLFSAAVLGCRFMTAYHGLIDRAAVRPGEWVAIFGLGGVGLSAVQIASTLGAQVIAVDSWFSGH